MNTDPFGEIYARQHAAAYNVARRMLNESTSEDVASETMLRAWKRLSTGADPSAVVALVPVIAYGLAVDEYRRLDVPAGLGHEDDWLGSLLAAKALSADQDAFAGDFDAAVRDLDGDDFDAFVLTDLRGLPEREAASVLGLAQKTINRRRARARQTLQEEIAA